MNSINYKGYTITVEQDLMCESPRTFDNLGTLAAFHRNYNDESSINSDEFKSLNAIKKHITSKSGLDAICLPVYLYSHSGDTISTTPFSCRWDSGQLGFIYCSKEQVRKDFSWKRITAKRLEEIKKYLKSEVDQYDKYLTGEVWFTSITKEGDDEIIDCCGEMYDDIDNLIADAKSMCDGYETFNDLKDIEKVKKTCKELVS